MLSILTIDYSNIFCNGSYKSASDYNNLILKIKPNTTQLTNYKLEITKTDGSVVTNSVSLDENDIEFITFDVPISFYSNKGTMKIRLLSDEGNSDYTYLVNNEDSIADQDICINYNDETGNFVVKVIKINNADDLPIATNTRLGVIKVGATLNIQEDGLLNANEGEGIEAITNTELEAMLI